MRRRILLPIIAALLWPLHAIGQTDALNGFCSQGGVSAAVQGLNSTNKLAGIIPSCQVTVFLTGTTTKAALFKDAIGTTLSNPFTADALGAAAPGKWLFYAADGQGYDVVMSGGIPPNTYPSPVTLTDLGGSGGVCGTNFIPCLNTPNTWLTGIQRFMSSSSTDIPIIVQGHGGGFATPSFVQATTTQVSGPFFGCAITLLNPVTAGDAILMMGSPPHQPQVVTDSLGNTYSLVGIDTSSGGRGLAVFIATNVIGGTDTITFNGLQEVSGCLAAEYAGIAPSNAVDVSLVTGSGSVLTTFPLGPITTTLNNDAVITVLTGGHATTAPAGYTLNHNGQSDPQSADIELASAFAPTPGNYSATWTGLGSVEGVGWSAILIGLKAQANLVQSTDLTQWESYTTAVLSRVNNQGQFVLPSTPGLPTNIPLAGALAYDSTANVPSYFNGASWVHFGSGGGSSPLTTKGDIFGFSNANARIPVGSNGQVLTADSANVLGVSWQNASGGVSTVINSDGTLAISPNSGAVIASLALGHANTWTALQTHSAGINLSGGSSPFQLGGSAGTPGQCPISGGSGITPTWGACGSAIWNTIGNPTGNLALSMSANTSVFTFGSSTGTTPWFSWLNSAGVGWGIAGDGSLRGQGSTTTHGLVVPEGTALSGVASSDVLTTDSSLHRLVQNPNNIGELIVPGETAAITAGHLWAAASNGIDMVDGGAPGACSTCVTAAASLANNQLMLGQGSQTSATLGSLGTTTTVLHGNASGAPSFGAVALSTDVSGNLPNGNLATQTANTVLGALTATTPSGLAMPSCSGATDALIWTSGTGFGCNTISAGTGLSGMTATQVPIAATATTVTSSKALAGSGAGITTGPTTTTSTDLASYTGAGGQLADSGVLLASVCAPGSFAAQTDGTTVTWAIGTSICANADLTFTVHSGSRTLNLTGMENGGSYVLLIKQDSTGGEGLTLGSGCTWKVGGGGTGAITPSTAANAIDILAWTYDGTNCYLNFRTNFD